MGQDFAQIIYNEYNVFKLYQLSYINIYYFTARRSDSIEVGSEMMKMTTNSKPTKCAYVRTQDLEKHITDLVKHHMKLGNMRDSEMAQNEFADMIWIKIGVSRPLQESNVPRLCKCGSMNRGPNTANAHQIPVC